MGASAGTELVVETPHGPVKVLEAVRELRLREPVREHVPGPEVGRWAARGSAGRGERCGRLAETSGPYHRNCRHLGSPQAGSPGAHMKRQSQWPGEMIVHVRLSNGAAK